MKLIVAVVAKDIHDFEEYFNNWREKNVEFYYVYESFQIRGLDLNGVIITQRAKYEIQKRKLYDECLRIVRY